MGKNDLKSSKLTQKLENSLTFKFSFTHCNFFSCVFSSHPEKRFAFSFCSANTAVRGKGKCGRPQSQGTSRVFAGQFMIKGCTICFCGLQYIPNKLNSFMIVVLQALVHEDPSYVVKRYESRKYAIDESVTNEYLKVCCLGCLNNPYPVYTATQTSCMFIHC